MKRILILFSILISISCFSQKDTLSPKIWSIDSTVIEDDYIVKFNTHDSGFISRLVIMPALEIRENSKLVAYQLYDCDKLIVIDSAATIRMLFMALKQQADNERKKYINK